LNRQGAKIAKAFNQIPRNRRSPFGWRRCCPSWCLFALALPGALAVPAAVL